MEEKQFRKIRQKIGEGDYEVALEQIFSAERDHPEWSIILKALLLTHQDNHRGSDTLLNELQIHKKTQNPGLIQCSQMALRCWNLYQLTGATDLLRDTEKKIEELNREEKKQLSLFRGFLKFINGELYLNRKMSETAVQYFRKAGFLFDFEGASRLKALSLSRIADIYAAIGFQDGALRYREDAIHAFTDAKLSTPTADQLMYQGELLLKMGRKRLGVAQLKKAAHLYKSEGLEDRQQAAEALIPGL